MLEFECPHCKAILTIPEQFVGTQGTCRKCDKPITIEATATHDPSENFASMTALQPALVAFHCESTGPSSRKCNITELAGMKFNLKGEELDSFTSFANPGHLIPPRISEKTGITDEMVEHAPTSYEVVKRWFDWVGPHAFVFSHHAHFNAKFIAATVLKEDVDPPLLDIIDALGWAREMEVPVSEYKLRALLDVIGYPVKRTHRALETCHGVAALVNYLIKRHVGSHVVSDQAGVLGKLLGKRVEVVNQASAFTSLKAISKPLEEMCGEGFYDKARNDRRSARTQQRAFLASAASSAVQQPKQDDTPRHQQEWFDERRGILERAQRERAKTAAGRSSGVLEMVDDTPWDYVLLEASQCEDPEEQKRLCHEAVSLGAREPWPFDRLAALYIKTKDYETAHRLCEEYFEGQVWTEPKWADAGLRILRRLEKLERRLARNSQAG